VTAGFPSPADDYLEQALNLDELLVKNRVATYYVRVRGWSMLGAGIHDGDILMVDRAVQPTNGKIAIVMIDAEFTVKRLCLRDGRLFLQPENEQFAPQEISLETDFTVWGIVTCIIHPV
jgi:DNA polymerase V